MVTGQFLFKQMSVFISRYSSGNICFLRGLGRADVMKEFVRVFSRWKDFHGRSTRREFWMCTLSDEGFLMGRLLIGILLLANACAIANAQVANTFGGGESVGAENHLWP